MHDAIAILCLFLRADTIPCKNYDPQSVFTLFKMALLLCATSLPDAIQKQI